MTGYTRLLRGRESALEAAVLGGLALFYAATTVPNIANHPIAGGDEGWIISASAKLAEQGVFGSDLFTGFFGADKNYYFNLPLHHLVLAAVFKVFGVGLAQARLTSTVFGLAALGLTYALGRRVGGRWAGMGAAGLLVLLRLNLAPFTGLILTDLGATVRYDLIAVPFALGAVMLLPARVEDPSLLRLGLAGFVLGLGCITQFIDIFLVAPLALYLLTLALPWRTRMLGLVAFGIAILLPFVPYAVYAAAGWHDFDGQSRTGEEETGERRTDFLSPAFYLDNLTAEADRYNIALGFGSPSSLSELVERPSARLVLLFAGPLALAYCAWRARRGSLPHRLLTFVLVALLLEFALFESTKRFVYWVIVVPFLCIALADAAVALTSWRPRRAGLRPIALGAAAAATALFAIEGAAVGVRNVADARDAPKYSAMGAEVRSLVPPGSRVLTDNRMWPALRDRDPRSLFLLFYWTNPKIAGDELTDIEGAMKRIDAGYLLLSPLSKEMLAHLSSEDSDRLARYMSEHARLVATVSEAPYGPIEVYELR